MLARPPHRGETPITVWCVEVRTRQPITPKHRERRMDGGAHTITSSLPCDHETEDATPVRQSSLSARRPTRRNVRHGRDRPVSRNKTIREGLNRPPIRNETIRPRDRDRTHSRPLQPTPPNRETLAGQLALPTIPQQTADHPEHAIERGNHDSQTSTEKDEARVDDEPLHRDVEDSRAGTRATTTRGPVLGAHAARVVERTRKRNTVTKTHFRSDLSHWADWYIVASPCHTVSYDVNAVLLQHTPNLLNILLIHAGNTNSTIDAADPVLNNFKLKRDAVHPKNYLPAQ